MDVENLLQIYQEGLMASSFQVTCTGLSDITDNVISHDKFTRLLSSGFVNEKHVWKQAKVICQELVDNEAVFIVDDSIQAKPYTDESELICWHYDHVSGKTVKGVCFLTGLYYGDGISVPAGIEFVTKPIKTVNNKGKQVRKATKSKNTLFREIVGHGFNNLDFKYVLADSWFGNSKNMKFINQNNRLFVFAIKSNRKVALSLEDKQNGRYTSIKSMKLEGRSKVVYFEQLDFPVVITCQVFKNGDDTAVLYLASNDLGADSKQITTIYKKKMESRRVS